MRQQQKSDEDIATLVNADVDEVRAAIMLVETWIAANDRPMVVAKMHEQALVAASGVGKVLTDAQRAELLLHPGTPEMTLKEIDPETKAEITRTIPEQPPIYGADHQTRLEAVKMTAEVVKAVAASGPSTQIAIGINNNQQGVTGGNGRSFEARLRARREELGMNAQRQLPAAEVIEEDIPDAVIESGDPTEEELIAEYEDDMASA